MSDIEPWGRGRGIYYDYFKVKAGGIKDMAVGLLQTRNLLMRRHGLVPPGDFHAVKEMKAHNAFDFGGVNDRVLLYIC